MNIERLKIIDFALDRFLKISAFNFASGELYIKVYTERTLEDVIDEFESQRFEITELYDTIRQPKLINNDTEPGIEFIITFSTPKYPPILLGNGMEI